MTTTTAAEAALALRGRVEAAVDRLLAQFVWQGGAHEVVVVATWSCGTAEVLLAATSWAVAHVDAEVVVAVWPRWLAHRYLVSCPESCAVLARVGPGECAIMIATADGDGDTDRIEVVRRRVVPRAFRSSPSSSPEIVVGIVLTSSPVRSGLERLSATVGRESGSGHAGYFRRCVRSSSCAHLRARYA